MRKVIALVLLMAPLSQAIAHTSMVQQPAIQISADPTEQYPQSALEYLEREFAVMPDANFLAFLEQTHLYNYSNYEFPPYFQALYNDTDTKSRTGVLFQVPATQEPRFRTALKQVARYSVVHINEIDNDVYTAGLERLKISLLNEFTNRRNSIMQNSTLRVQAYRLIGIAAVNGIVVTDEQGPWVYKMLPHINTNEVRWLNATEIEALMQASIQSPSHAMHDYFLSLAVTDPRIRALQKLSGREEWLTLGATQVERNAINEVMTRYETARQKGERDFVKIYGDLRENSIIHDTALSETILKRMLEAAAKAPNTPNGTTELLLFTMRLFDRMPTERFQHWLPVLAARANEQTRSMLIHLMDQRIRFFYEEISGSQLYDMSNAIAHIETFGSKNLGEQALKEIRMQIDLHATLNAPLETQPLISNGTKLHIKQLLAVLPPSVLKTPEARAIVSVHGSLWSRTKNLVNEYLCEKALTK